MLVLYGGAVLKRISVCNLGARAGFCTAWLPADNGPVRCGRDDAVSAKSISLIQPSPTPTLTLSAKSNNKSPALQKYTSRRVP